MIVNHFFDSRIFEKDTSSACNIVNFEYLLFFF